MGDLPDRRGRCLDRRPAADRSAGRREGRSGRGRARRVRADAGRPLVDTLTGSKLADLKELRPRQANIRVLFVFDPWRSAILLVAGDKTGQWLRRYEGAIPQAEQLFALYLQERAKAEEEGGD